jgi:dipeptidyl aminopeptidase/acylaminoacyl peptidase
MRRLCVVLFTLLYVLPLLGQAKHPFTFDDMMALKRVGEPVPSPDGKWVLFSAVDVDLATNTKTPHIWAVPISGGAEHEIIGAQDADRPRWSPDGKRFAFISNNQGGSQIWIANFDGASGTVTHIYKLTDIATEAGGELWSPDGISIAFTSDVYPECDGAPKEEQDCNFKKTKDAENSKVKALVFERLLYRHWNAYKAGKRMHILVVSAPGVGFATKGSSIKAEEQPNSQTAASIPLGGGPLEQMLFRVPPRDLTPGNYDAPPFSLGGQDDYAFSPDGKELCFTSNHDKVEATSTNNDLWIVPVNIEPGASPERVREQTKNITADNPASDSTPFYSPDGKYIAYRSQKRPGYESDRFRLMLYDRKTGEKRNLTEDFDRWVGTFIWNPTSAFIYFVAENDGGSSIYMVSPSEGQTGHLRWPLYLLNGFNDDLIATPDGKEILFTKMSISGPNDIYRVSSAPSGDCVKAEIQGKWKSGQYDSSCVSSIPDQVTHLNSSILSQVSISPLEPFWFEGAHGDKVQGFLVKPPNFDPSKKYPVKFLVHGGPQGAWGDDWSYRWNPELFAANGYVVIMINFHGSTGYGQKFIDAINGDWGGAPFEDLMKGLDYAEKTYPFIDKNRECALGASYGGYMANWILGHTDRFKCIVSHDGQFNTTSAWGTTEELWFPEWEFKGTPYSNRAMYDKWSPHLSAENFKTPTLVVHGQLDYRLDVSEGFQLFTTLQRRGVPSKMLYFPDEGHWVLKPQNSQLWYKTVNDWVDQWTK